MKALILYRSYYGNTRQAAEAMAEQVRSMGHEAEARDLRQRLPDLTATDAVIVGAPTRMGKVSGRARKTLSRLKKKSIGKGLVAVFDTCGILPKTPEEIEKFRQFFEPGAAGILMARARELGLNVYPETVRCEVAGMKGPLAEGMILKARSFASDIVYFVGKR